MLLEASWVGGCVGPAHHEFRLERNGILTYRASGTISGSSTLQLNRVQSAQVVERVRSLLSKGVAESGSSGTAHSMTIRFKSDPELALESHRAAAIESWLLQVVRDCNEETDNSNSVLTRLDRGICAYCSRRALHEVVENTTPMLTCRACGAAFLMKVPPSLVRDGDRTLAQRSPWPLELAQQPSMPDGVRAHLYVTEDLYAIDIYDGDSLIVSVEARFRILIRIQEWLQKATLRRTPIEAVRAYLIELARESHSDDCVAECICRDESGDLPVCSVPKAELEAIAQIIRRTHPAALEDADRLVGTVTKYAEIRDYRIYEEPSELSDDECCIWLVRCAPDCRPVISCYMVILSNEEDTLPG